MNGPSALVVVGALLFALGLLLMMSFRQNDGALFAFAFTTANYSQALSNELFWRLLIRSVLISAFVTAATVVIAYPVAYYIAFHGGSRRNLLLLLVTLPFWTSYLLRIFAWKVILGYNGVINSALVALGIPGAPLESLLYTPQAMILTLAHAYAAFAILPLYVSLSAIEPKLIEAAEDLGASRTQVLRRVVIPLSAPGLLAASILVFIPTLGDYATPTLVGGPSSTMIANLIQAQFGKANNWPYGATIAILPILPILILGIPIAMMVLARRRFRFHNNGE